MYRYNVLYNVMGWWMSILIKFNHVQSNFWSTQRCPRHSLSPEINELDQVDTVRYQTFCHPITERKVMSLRSRPVNKDFPGSDTPNPGFFQLPVKRYSRSGMMSEVLCGYQRKDYSLPAKSLRVLGIWIHSLHGKIARFAISDLKFEKSRF